MTSVRSLPGASPASITAPISTSAPTPIIGSRPKRSQSQPESGEATYMPPRWSDTADADRLHAVPLVVQVHRRRRRGADHHELADRQRGQRDLHAHVAQDRAERRAPARRRGRRARRLVELARDGQRIGAQEQLDEQRGDRVAGDADQERAGRRRRCRASRPDAERRLHQVRPDDRAARSSPRR